LELHPGLYEAVVTNALAEALAALDEQRFASDQHPLDGEDAGDLLVPHVADVLGRALRILPADAEGLGRQLVLCNKVLQLIRQEVPKTYEDAHEEIVDQGRLLLALLRRPENAMRSIEVPRPRIPLSSSALLVNDRREPSLAAELATEIASADSIDLLCAFIRWTGLRVLLDPLRGFLDEGRTLRVITSTYMGATERRAIDELTKMGAEVKVSYESKSTRLHAKAWSFHRNTGFSTAYVGSSNLSHSALHEGLEWNVRLSRVDASSLLEKFKATFETYWADPYFELYDPAKDAPRFDRSVESDRPAGEIDFSFFDIRPYGFQQQILYQLDVERKRHGRWQNLVVAATGTGKTVVAALDYRRLSKEWQGATLLFVAHRKEILSQSLSMFRAVLKDGSFGEMLVQRAKPTEGQHVFASIQTLSQMDLAELSPGAFDIVIVDEFHHAAARTYQRLLTHLKPRMLLGLTATPERADGTNVADLFAGHIASELRVWEALEQGLLAPFQYFGIHDDVDLSGLRWQRGGYQVAELENVYTGDDARVSKILASIRQIVSNPLAMRALGFCVSIRHAEFMSRKFSQAGIPSASINAASSKQDRDTILRRLKDREINVVFAVDLFNEGIDVPEIDTVLFLRPTESSTVFLQQLGRGLRPSEDKSCLTALDFVGHQNKKFRFDQRFRALMGASRSEVRKSVEQGFPFLPAGCHIELDRVSQQIVLENLRQALGSTWRSLVTELRQLGDVSLGHFLRETDLDLRDVYRRNRSWTALRREAALPAAAAGPDEDQLGRSIGNLLHIDDPLRLNFYKAFLSGGSRDADDLDDFHQRLLVMLHFGLWRTGRPFDDVAAGFEALNDHPAVLQELLEVIDLLDEGSAHISPNFALPLRAPLQIHARYTASEVMASLGEMTTARPWPPREGVRHSKVNNADVFFVTLQKTEKEYSPTTMYRDYAISPNLFHWESQSTTSEASATGQRYINHAGRGGHILLFVRERKEEAGRPLPYWFVGPAKYVSHEGERPMGITWRLEVDLPPDLFASFKVAAA